jgi:hypothetical protein
MIFCRYLCTTTAHMIGITEDQDPCLAPSVSAAAATTANDPRVYRGQPATPDPVGVDKDGEEERVLLGVTVKTSPLLRTPSSSPSEGSV